MGSLKRPRLDEKQPIEIRKPDPAARAAAPSIDAAASHSQAQGDISI